MINWFFKPFAFSNSTYYRYVAAREDDLVQQRLAAKEERGEGIRNRRKVGAPVHVDSP